MAIDGVDMTDIPNIAEGAVASLVSAVELITRSTHVRMDLQKDPFSRDTIEREAEELLHFIRQLNQAIRNAEQYRLRFADWEAA